MPHRSIFLSCLAPWVAAACATAPPAPPAERAPTPVSASFGRTWEAALDALAARNIPIRAVERESGLIATEPSIAPRADAPNAVCGTVVLLRHDPERALFNVLVRGDSARATVRAVARWTRTYGDGKDAFVEECTTTGRWESELEAQIKARAEAGRG